MRSGCAQGLVSIPQPDRRLASSMLLSCAASSDDFAMLDACSRAVVAVADDVAGTGPRSGLDGLLLTPNVLDASGPIKFSPPGEPVEALLAELPAEPPAGAVEEAPGPIKVSPPDEPAEALPPERSPAPEPFAEGSESTALERAFLM